MNNDIKDIIKTKCSEKIRAFYAKHFLNKL